jgi:hypothetical protein
LSASERGDVEKGVVFGKSGSEGEREGVRERGSERERQ